MKYAMILLLGSVLFSGCGAIGAELKSLSEAAKAEDNGLWKVERRLLDAISAAKIFLAQKGGEVKSEKTGKGIWGNERILYAEAAGVRRELHLDELRVNNGPIPDQDNCRVRKAVLQKQEGGAWVDAPAAEVEAFAKEYVAFAKNFK